MGVQGNAGGGGLLKANSSLKAASKRVARELLSSDPCHQAYPVDGGLPMEGNFHSMSNLFAQLGLPSESADIQAFIESKRPLDADLELHEAPFWTSSQSEFLREQVQDDADWAGVIDELNSGLRQALP